MPMTSTPTTNARTIFAARISALEATTYPAPDTILGHSLGMDLLSELGCRTYNYMGGKWVEAEHTIDAADEPLALEIFSRLYNDSGIRGTADTPYSILDGLCRNNRWRACLNTPAHAFMLADLTLRFVTNATRYTREYPGQMVDGVASMLSQWLGLERDQSPISSFEDTARSMFGDAWWDFSVPLDVSDQWAIAAHMLDLVERTRPDFLPSVLPVITGLAGTTPLDLPVLGAFNP